MKTPLFLCLALAALAPARAEIFRSDAGRGSHRSDGRSGRDHDHNDRTSVRIGIGVGHGYGYGYGGRYYSPYRYVPNYTYFSGYGYGYPYYDTSGYYGSGSGAANGLVLGALAGGIIGNNSGEFRHNGWRGAAWGAGLGWLLGSVADANRRRSVYESAPVIVQGAPAVQAQPAAPQQPVTIINNYYNTSTPMTSANGLFGR